MRGPFPRLRESDGAAFGFQRHFLYETIPLQCRVKSLQFGLAIPPVKRRKELLSE